jgi:hypothetical protein
MLLPMPLEANDVWNNSKDDNDHDSEVQQLNVL